MIFYVVEFVLITTALLGEAFSFVAGFHQHSQKPTYSSLSRERGDLPVSLELVVKRQLRTRRDEFGGEKSNSELPIHSPLRRGENEMTTITAKARLGFFSLLN